MHKITLRLKLKPIEKTSDGDVTMKILKMRNSGNMRGLLDLASEFPENTIMAEIGSYAGESTLLFFKSGKVKQLFAIDPWKGGYNYATSPEVSDFVLVENAFDERIKGMNVVKLKMTMQEALELLPELDVIYIDGNHAYEYVVSDIKLSLQKIKKSGIICGHDYNDVSAGVVCAVNEMFGKPDKIFSDSSWMVKL